jgi:aryl-alcohol dehydrogenase-like predicted oxidoreductase
MSETGTAMKYGRVPGLEKPVSRLVLGTMNQVFHDLAHACAMADHFLAAGGNCFDTAYIYGEGEQERLLGQWLKSRSIRDEVVVICKGAHLPFCDPVNLCRQLTISLERLAIEHTDLYMMHRDNPDIPVGEFVDVMNELKDNGLLHAFGGSNWSTERLQAARDYAAAHGKTGFALSSPNVSLARWNRPVWEGCVTATDAASRDWYERTQMALFAWSSQAQGFLTGRYTPEDREQLGEDSEVVQVWFNDDNFERLARVRKLASDRGLDLSAISLAYVLCLPLNLFALVGPQTIDELNQALAAVQLNLTADEVAWLDLR